MREMQSRIGTTELKEDFNRNMNSKTYQIPFKHDVKGYQDYKRNCTSISPFS